jgi:hypothetical protein
MERAVRKAGKQLVRDFGEVEHLQVSVKGPSDFVSTADHASERTLKAELDPVGDLTSNADTKRHLASVLMKRLLGAAQAGRSALAA